MKKIVSIAFFLAAISAAANAQPGPGPAPNPWVQNGATISYSQGGVIVGSTVSGGSKGAGTINSTLYDNGTRVTNAGLFTAGTLGAARLPTPTATTLGGVESKVLVSHDFLTYIGTDGSVGQAQPAFSDLSGTIATGQVSGSYTGITGVGALTAGSLASGFTPVANALLAHSATTVNGQTCTLGSTCTVTAAATGVTVGSTTITGGTSGRIEYNNAGVLGEMTTSGSGTVVALAASPSISALTVTGSFTATGLVTNADMANSTISGISLGSNLGTLTFGTHLTSGGSSYNGSAGVTLTSDATNANTASTIVARDGSGNFTAGTITASVTGHSSLDLALSGGTMSGNIAMGGGNVSGGGTYTAAHIVGSTDATIGAGSAITSSGAGGALGTAAFKSTGTSGSTVPLLNGANTWSALQTLSSGFTVGAGTTLLGNQTPVTGGAMKQDNLLEVNATFPSVNEGSIWPLGQTYCFVCLSKEFTSTSVPTPGNAPLATLFAFAYDNNSGGAVVPVLGDCIVSHANGYCGSNLISRSGGGSIAAKLVPLELDEEFAVGDTPASGAAGMYINTFNGSNHAGTGNGAGIQLGGISGYFSNGFVCAAIAVGGSCLSYQNNSFASGAPDSLINTLLAGGLSYNTAAIRIGNNNGSNGQYIAFDPASGSNRSAFYEDTSNNLWIVNNDNAGGVIGFAVNGTTALALTSTGINSTNIGVTTPGTGKFTTINGNTFTTGTGTLTIAASKTLTDTSGVGASILLGTTGGGFTAYTGASSAGNVLTALSASGAGSFLAYTNANTASTLVQRDGSGNFTAGTITASLTGHSSLDLALTGGTMSGNIAMGGSNVSGGGTYTATHVVGSTDMTIGGGSAITSSGAGGAMGTAAFVNTGTSGGTVPLLNGTNTFSAVQAINANSGAAPALDTGSLFQVTGADATAQRIEMNTYASSGTFENRRLDGTNASVSAVVANDLLGTFQARGCASVSANVCTFSTAANIQIVALDSFSSSQSGGYFKFNATASGTNTSTLLLNMSAAGALFQVPISAQGSSSIAQTNVACMNSVTFLISYQAWTTGCAVSAARFKTDFAEQSRARDLSVVMGLIPKDYRYKADVMDGGKDVHHGFVAEDVEKVAPELVEYEADGTTTHGVKYNELSPYLVGAMQAMQGEITRLRAENDNLRASNAAFDDRLSAIEHAGAGGAIPVNAPRVSVGR